LRRGRIAGSKPGNDSDCAAICGGTRNRLRRGVAICLRRTPDQVPPFNLKFRQNQFAAPEPQDFRIGGASVAAQPSPSLLLFIVAASSSPELPNQTTAVPMISRRP
jgi:hypothetical protein